MKLTETAANIILSIMKTKKLDPSKVHFEIVASKGKMCFGFTKDRHGTVLNYGELNVVVGTGVADVVLDYGSVKGRNGLIVLEDHDT